ncbi:LysR family transcriptional regulator, partial [Burkholderia pseudomallei]
HNQCYAPERLQASASMRLLREWMLAECPCA